jgi:hypothetical protein
VTPPGRSVPVRRLAFPVTRPSGYSAEDDKSNADGMGWTGTAVAGEWADGA